MTEDPTKLSDEHIQAIIDREYARFPRRLYFGPCTTLTPSGPCGNTTLDATGHCSKCGARV